MSYSTTDVINGLDQARGLAFSSPETFPQVLRQVLNFVNHDDIAVKYWCASFLKDTFSSDNQVVSYSTKIDLAIDSVDGLIALSNVNDLRVFQHVVDTSIMVYRLVFKYVNDNDGSGDVWGKLNQLKINLTSKFDTNFPLDSSGNDESDKFRNTFGKIELIKFIILVIDYQTKSNSNVDTFNLNFVSSNHSLIKKNAMQTEALGLLDNLLNIFNYDILIPPLVNPLLIHLTVLVKRKNQFIPKILSTIEKFDTADKLQSNYQSVEEFKLSKKYIDRLVRIFISHLFKYELVSNNYHTILTNKLTLLIRRGDDLRRKDITAPSEDDDKIQKKKFEGFVNGSKRLTTLDYKSLYCLTDIDNQLNKFDLATLPQHILISMTLNALNRTDVNKLTKALDIISERYKYGLENQFKLSQDELARKRIKLDINGDSDDDDDNIDYDPKSVYNLPPPKELSFQDKREQINLIIRNFFNISESNVNEIEESVDNNVSNNINKELTKIAITSWQKKSWIIILTRLATRGMRTIDNDDVINDEKSIDSSQSHELSDLIRNALFDYFLENIHSRVDLIIEWLNEEWYSETVYNEMKLKAELKAKYLKKYESGEIKDLDAKIREKLESKTFDTPIYDKWSSKVLDSLIPFLEANDRKIFIRLLSDLPVLNSQLVSRIKSLCYDPVRIKLGFLSIQFLIMYRPPVKDSCIDILKELSESDQDDLKQEASKLLKKFS